MKNEVSIKKEGRDVEASHPGTELTRTRELGSSASALRMNEVATGRCVRMSWSALSDSGICSVRSDCVCGRVGAHSRTETTWVIPRLVSCASSRAVKRSVRYNRGSTSLAVFPRRNVGRRPLRCCAAAMRDVCQGWGLKESILRRGEEVARIGGLREGYEASAEGHVARPSAL
jgi:hypothetical protein